MPIPAVLSCPFHIETYTWSPPGKQQRSPFARLGHVRSARPPYVIVGRESFDDIFFIGTFRQHSRQDERVFYGLTGTYRTSIVKQFVHSGRSTYLPLELEGKIVLHLQRHRAFLSHR